MLLFMKRNLKKNYDIIQFKKNNKTMKIGRVLYTWADELSDPKH